MTLVQELFAVYDSKAESFGQPFFAVNAAVATRMFQAAVQDPETPVGRHPEDFSLFRIGIWNADTGVVAGVEAPQHVTNGLALVKKGGE